MCTLSIFRKDGGFFVTMNRDESHERASERPPEYLNDAKTIMAPVDPAGGGTWMAGNEVSHHWGCLLNGYFEDNYPGRNYGTASKSRGEILPNLLTCDDPFAAVQDMKLDVYRSFRLVLGDKNQVQLYIWDGVDRFERSEFHVEKEDQAYFLTSSSWKQNEVIDTRISIFNQWWDAENAADVSSVPSFHEDITPESSSSILMHRSYSRTKSITTLDNSGSELFMHHQFVSKDRVPVSKIV